ncbi:hypothetical protein Tco_0041585, partial [Tanacetum coccineum]
MYTDGILTEMTVAIDLLCSSGLKQPTCLEQAQN